MHGGIKVYRGAAAAARHYVETGHARADDYYLAEGSGLAEHYIAQQTATDTSLGARSAPGLPGTHEVRHVASLDGDAYETWVAGYDPATGAAKGRLRTDEHGVRFVEVVVNGPKTWSLAAAVDPEIAAAYDAAQERAARQIIGWVAEHGTTRVGPAGRQIQVPLERVDGVLVRHQTSRAGDPHRHLHLQINARVWALGKWRGIHTVGVRDSLDAINGIGHAAVLCDPEFRTVLAERGYTLDPATGEIDQLAPFVPRFSARTAQIGGHLDRFEAEWRAEHPGEEPGPRLRQAWDTRAWATLRPDKAAPRDGEELRLRWVSVLRDELGFTPPTPADTGVPIGSATTNGLGEGRPGAIDRDEVAEKVLLRLGEHRSAWNAADVRGEVEQQVAATGVVAAVPVRNELAEDITARALGRCVPLLPGDEVPEHVRALTSPAVLAVEADLSRRLATRAARPDRGPMRSALVGDEGLDTSQRDVVAAIAGAAKLVVIEGAAGAGKTTTLAAARVEVEQQGGRLMVVTPTRKAAEVAAREVGTTAETVHWLTTQHGFHQDQDGRWRRWAPEYRRTAAAAWLARGDVLVVDEAGMLTQDLARALCAIADEAGAHLVLLGDRHQLPAVGRGGVLDLAARHCAPEAHLTLDTVHRFTDPDYADLSLLMRTGEHAGEVFDALLARGQVRIHPTDVERTHHLAALLTDSRSPSAHQPAHQPAHQAAHQDAHQGAHQVRGRAQRRPVPPLVVAHTNQQVSQINHAVRDHRATTGELTDHRAFTTRDGQRIGIGDQVATRLNDRDLRVANRDTWTITDITRAGLVRLQPTEGRRGRSGRTGRTGRTAHRVVPAAYAVDHLELAYATTAHGAQGETVEDAHTVIDDHTSAASAYVGMTRGRHHNTAHLVAETTDDARRQWIDTFSRDRADLGPAHATDIAAEHVARYGTQPRRRPPARTIGPYDYPDPIRRPPELRQPYPSPGRRGPAPPSIG